MTLIYLPPCIFIIYIGVPKLFVQINTGGREHQNKYISIKNIWSLKLYCNVRGHFVTGADVSCCVGVADWECVLTFNCSEIYWETHRFSRNHYRLVPATVNMERFMHAEMADMHLVYGSANGNGANPFQHCCEESSECHLRESMDRPRWSCGLATQVTWPHVSGFLPLGAHETAGVWNRCENRRPPRP